MELRHTRIPVRFLEHLPEGLKYLHRDGKAYIVVEELACPRGHSHMATSVHTHEEPSIRMKVRTGGREGLIFVDAFWCSHDKLHSFLPVQNDASPVLEAFKLSKRFQVIAPPKQLSFGGQDSLLRFRCRLLNQRARDRRIGAQISPGARRSADKGCAEAAIARPDRSGRCTEQL